MKIKYFIKKLDLVEGICAVKMGGVIPESRAIPEYCFQFLSFRDTPLQPIGGRKDGETLLIMEGFFFELPEELKKEIGSTIDGKVTFNETVFGLNATAPIADVLFKKLMPEIKKMNVGEIITGTLDGVI